ncbi:MULTISPECIES: hypothetical protein [unclassified Microbacterium]|uniref:hypothetical protein n=1 Tax=unclassified Microbacterium TaxID=2609290 RepID=UPI000EAA517A|nr:MULTISPECIES: hypothetical protein [unclassified Microbacterium]MBT2484786.1 hypothetical protein [Microbacterium sp. ISL-108]RKN67662.1 hypothetical protein D7252_08745 [Microbacterium sp. CGR2]
MSTNSLTYAQATGITSDAQRNRIAADHARYQQALKAASRAVLDGYDALAVLDGYDALAAHAYESARRVAHVASTHGNPGPLIDQLERAYADDSEDEGALMAVWARVRRRLPGSDGAPRLADAVSLTAEDHRSKAGESDRRALRAHSPAESRALRREAREHRLSALLAEYHLSDSPTRV